MRHRGQFSSKGVEMAFQVLREAVNEGRVPGAVGAIVTPEGIIEAPRVLRAIAKAYETASSDNLPPPCEEIYLTIEVFAGTADLPREIYHEVKDSVDYWRQFVPEDGRTLDRWL